MWFRSDEVIIYESYIGLLFKIALGILIVGIPLGGVAMITGASEVVILKYSLVFAGAAFLVWLFSKYQFIENGIVGLMLGSSVYKHFEWHPVACILIGAAAIAGLFYITYIKVGFWIKAAIFSIINTLLVYMIFYSEGGVLQLPDNIWRVSVFIILLLENMYIRFVNSSMVFKVK